MDKEWQLAVKCVSFCRPSSVSKYVVFNSISFYYQSDITHTLIRNHKEYIFFQVTCHSFCVFRWPADGYAEHHRPRLVRRLEDGGRVSLPVWTCHCNVIHQWNVFIVEYSMKSHKRKLWHKDTIMPCRVSRIRGRQTQQWVNLGSDYHA